MTYFVLLCYLFYLIIHLYQTFLSRLTDGSTTWVFPYPNFRSHSPERFCKKGVFKNFAKSAGKHNCAGVFFNKVTTLELYWKRDSNTNFFLWILQNSSEHLFYRTPLCDCFYICKINKKINKIHRKTPVPECLFIKVVGLKQLF